MILESSRSASIEVKQESTPTETLDENQSKMETDIKPNLTSVKSELKEKFQTLKRAFKETLDALEVSEMQQKEDYKTIMVNKETLRMLKLKTEECNRLERNLNATKLELEAMRKMAQSLAIKNEILLNDHSADCAKLRDLQYEQNVL